MDYILGLNITVKVKFVNDEFLNKITLTDIKGISSFLYWNINRECFTF